MLSSTVATGFANADSIQNNVLSSLIFDDSSDMFNIAEYSKSTTAIDIRSYGDDFNKDSVWSTEYEEYVNPTDFTIVSLVSTDNVNQYMGNNPTASDGRSFEVFIYNETAGDYHLQ